MSWLTDAYNYAAGGAKAAWGGYKEYGPGGGYRKAAKGARAAGDEYNALADRQKQYFEQGTQQAQGYWGQAQDAYNRIYGNQPSLSEQYAKEMSGKDPFSFERGQSAKAINAEMAARGGGNSGAALAAQALGQSEFDSRLMQYRGQLAGQADQARGAQFGAQQGISAGRAGTTMQGAAMAGGAYSDAYSAGIGARYNSAALQGQGQTADWNGLVDIAKAGAAAYTGNPAMMAGGGQGGVGPQNPMTQYGLQGGNPAYGGANPQVRPASMDYRGGGYAPQNPMTQYGLQGGNPAYGGANPLSPGAYNPPYYGSTDPFGRMSY